MAASSKSFTMSLLNSGNLRILLNSRRKIDVRSQFILFRALSNKSAVKLEQGEDEFRVLDIGYTVKNFLASRKRSQIKRQVASAPRADKMPVDQDWTSVWPTARTFHPASVPLPLHQGWVPVGKPPPGKFANAELMKIPNFLHLTPPAIQKQCEALKKFCTPWPKELETEEQINNHFPVQFISSDYCHSSPTVRDPRARIVTLQVKLSSLPLNRHAKDKLLRLLKERYDEKTKTISLIAERCPLRNQNKDYATYLLNVLISESWKTEPWEHEKSEPDMEKYVWEGSASQRGLKKLLSPEELTSDKVNEYSESVVRLHNEGEDSEVISQYKRAVKAILLKM